MKPTNMPYLPYAGTSGHSGSDTSRDRAVDSDRSGQTKERQKQTLETLYWQTERGITWKELSDQYGWHHGTASGVLSVLHKAGRIERLVERRNKCKIYVLKQYVNGRPYEKHGGKRNSREEIIREIEAFAGDYSHFINGREVLIVDQLLTFLKGKR